MAEGFVLLDGATQVSGLRSLWWVLRRWPALRKEMMTAGGYIQHRVWYVLPYTIGLTSWWEDEKSAYGFTRLPVHLAFWKWGTNAGHTRGGWLATYRFVGGGPLWGNGVESMMSTFGGVIPPAAGRPAKPPPEPKAVSNGPASLPDDEAPRTS